MKYPHGTCMWNRGQTEDHLYGFATKKDRDAYDRGDPGPFERVLRPLDAPPIDVETRLVRALCAGNLKEVIEHLSENHPIRAGKVC